MKQTNEHADPDLEEINTFTGHISVLVAQNDLIKQCILCIDDRRPRLAKEFRVEVPNGYLKYLALSHGQYICLWTPMPPRWS